MRLLVPQPDGAYVQDVVGGVGGELRRVAAAFEGRPVLDPKLSPDGTWVAFVQDGEIHVAPCNDERQKNTHHHELFSSTTPPPPTPPKPTPTPTTTPTTPPTPPPPPTTPHAYEPPPPTRVTFGARGHPHVTHGLAEYIAAEAGCVHLVHWSMHLSTRSFI